MKTHRHLQWYLLLAVVVLCFVVIWVVGVETVKGLEVEYEAPRTANLELVDPCYLDTVVCENEIIARITQYGWTGQKMASGKWPYVGAVATSDRSIAFGTKVVIDGKEYVVEDRTALWVNEQFDLPTFDIYSEQPSGLIYSSVLIN